MILPQKNWFAVYTKSRAEKKLYLELCNKNIKAFLPLRKEVKVWSDRKKLVELPLLPSYLFVHVSPADQFNVLNTPGAVRYVSFEGRPAPIQEQQILFLHRMIDHKFQHIEVDYTHIEQGDIVEVISGPLRGIRAEAVEIKGKHKLLLRFDSLRCCVHAEISMNEIVRVEQHRELAIH